MSGLLYGPRQARPLDQGRETIFDLLAWAKKNQTRIEQMPPLPRSGMPPVGKAPYSGRIVLESNTIYRPPAGNECSGVIALGDDDQNELAIWGFVYWGPARGGQANRRCLYQGKSFYQACKAVNDDLAYKVINDLWYSEGPLRPLAPEQLAR